MSGEKKEFVKRKNYSIKLISLSILLFIALLLTLAYSPEWPNLIKTEKRLSSPQNNFYFSYSSYRNNKEYPDFSKPPLASGQSMAASIFRTSDISQEEFSFDSFDRNQPLSSQGDSSDGLQILHVSPQGPTSSPHESEKIVVIFDRPMVPLQPLAPKEEIQTKDQAFSGEIEESSKDSASTPLDNPSNKRFEPDNPEKQMPLKIEPKTSGEFRWLGSRTLVFTPHQRFPFSTKIKVTIPPTTTALDGSRLGYEYSWEFETIRPRLLHHRPAHNDRWQPLQPEILLVFNQPMDEERASSFISWQTLSRKEKLSFKITHPKAEKLKEEGYELPPEYALLLTLPAPSKLEVETKYEINLRKGLPGKEGNLGLEKDYVFSFETYNHFRFLGLVEAEETRRKTDISATLQPTKIFSPDEAIPFKFSNPVSYKEFVSKVKFEPEVKIPDYYFNWEETSPLIYLSLPFEPETSYQVTIPAELKDEFGNQLGETFKINFSTGSFAPSVSMTTGHGVIEAYAEPAPCYFLEAINQKSIRIQAARLSAEVLVPIARQTGLFRSDKPYLPFPGFYQVDKDYPLNLPANKRRVVPINLIELHPSFKRGFIFLQVDRGGERDQWDRYLKVLLQVTDFGLSAKFSAENIIIWATDFKAGLPVSRAHLEIRDENNTVRWQGETDENGQAEAPGWRRLGLTPDPKQYGPPKLWILASHGENVAFISSDWDYGIDPFRFNLPVDWRPEPARFQGYIFTERGIYRAGETVHIKGVIREKIKGEWQIPSGLPSVNIEITDPVGQAVSKASARLDEFGSFNLDYKSSEESALGLYSIKATWPSTTPAKRSEAEFRGSFRIEAFRPVSFEIHLRSNKENYVFGDNFEATVSANYLFGGAMADQPLSWSLHLDRTFFSPPGHRGFIFGNQIDWDEEEGYKEKSRLVASQEVKLDPQGRLAIKLPLVAEKEKDSVKANLEATVTGPDRTSVSNRLQVIVHRGEFYIGLRPSTCFLKKNNPIEVEVIAAAPDGRLIPGCKIKVKLLRREWRSVRQAGVSHRWRWRSEREDIEVDEQSVTTEEQPVRLKFKPEKSGFYFFLASSNDSRRNPITTTTGFYVSGDDYVPWEQKEDDTIELVPESSSYRPGELARLLVKSPYEKAKALVSIEREFILEAKVIDLVGTSSFIEIPILPDYIPNIFVSVLLVQGRSSPPESERAKDDLGIPSFKIGYANLAIDPAEKRLEVKMMGLEPEYRPRDKVSFKVKVESQGKPVNKASVALACVDLGVLNLIGYELPDLFLSFYGPRPLSVRTSETRIHLVSQRQLGEKGEEPGGGVGEKVMAMAPSMAEIMLRGDFKSTAYWTPSVLTDENGEASISFILPDNLTTFSLMAVAQTKDSRFGRGETFFRVAKKLMLQASLPRFCRVGDAFEAGVVVHNFSPSKGEVALTLECSGLNLLDKAKDRRFQLSAGGSQEILFRFKAEKAGEATFAFKAKMGEETDGLEIKIPVELPRPTESVALAGELNGQERAETEERLIFPDKILADKSYLEVLAASSALLGLKGCLDGLEDYPYSCLEQRVSALLPYLVAKKLILDFKLTPLSEKEIDDLVRQRLKEIIGYQKEIGGFSAWPDLGETSPFLTCYATFALIKAREAGYDIPPRILTEAADYLLTFIRTEPKQARQPYSLRTYNSTKAYALYILSLLKRPQPVFMEKLYADRNNLSLFGKACLIKAMHQSQIMNQAKESLIKELLNKIKVTSGEAHFEDDEGRDGGWIYSSNGRTTALILQTLIETGTEHPSLAAVARWLVNRQRALMKGFFYSTQENFYLFWGLSEFYRTREKLAPEFLARFRLAGKPLLEARFIPDLKEVKKIRFNFNELFEKQKISSGREYALNVAKEGKGILYYGLRLNYVPSFPLPPRDEGIAVTKKIEPLDPSKKGRAANEIKAGSLVVITLEIAVPQELLYIVVEDPLPAGFEAVNPSFRTESEEAQRRLEALIETRPSRPRPWWTGFNHIERHDNRVILFADSLTPGVHVHRYLARALNFGTYIIPGTKVEQMYAPEVFGRSSEMVLKVVR